MKTYQDEPTLPGWRDLNVYMINADQLWIANSLEEAIRGAAETFGTEAGELIDEFYPPSRIGRLERLLYGVELTRLEQEAGEAAAKVLEEGSVPPALVGVLKI